MQPNILILHEIKNCYPFSADYQIPFSQPQFYFDNFTCCLTMKTINNRLSFLINPLYAAQVTGVGGYWSFF
jgi:hypothetical protein